MIGGFSPPPGTKEERELLSLFKRLNEENKTTLLKFAAFLGVDDGVHNKDSRDTEKTESPVTMTPLVIERPAKESVIKAIKRLNKMYPMLDKSVLLDQTSSLMTDHLIKGRDAESVIDDLEIMFKEAYDALQQG